MKTYRVTYAWAYGDLNETIKANTAQEAEQIFLHNMHTQYNSMLLRAACFKVLAVQETA